MGFFQNTFNNVKSNYQKNAQQPATQISKPKTTRDVLNQINLLRKTDKASADEYTKKLFTSMQDPSSRFYNPYNQATNKAVTNLQNLGFDMSSIDDDWYNRNSWLKDYYVQTANTNGLSSTMTNKRASKEQKAAYNYNQLWQAEENTKKAENEWNELQKELSYWAQRSDRNYSDEEIIGKIDWDRYKTLRKMDDTRLAGTPMELNRGIGYSEDAMYGVLWAARNGGSTGNLWLDMANSADGTGYKYDPEIASRLDPNSENFNPYAVGSTNIDDAALYFGVSGFTKEWVESHKDLAFSTDETEQKMYNKVREGYDNRTKAEQEYTELIDFINKKLKYISDPEKIMSRIDWKKYPTLAAMDKSIGQNGNLPTGNLVSMTEGLNYRYDDLKKQVDEVCAKKNGAAIDFASSIVGYVAGLGTPEPTEEQKQVVSERDKKLNEAAELMQDIATPAEQAVNENAGSSAYPDVKNVWNQVFAKGLDVRDTLTQNVVKSSIGNLSSSILRDSDIVQNYNTFKSELETNEKTRDNLKAELGDLVYYGKEIEENPTVQVEINGKLYDLKLSWDWKATMGEYNEETGERDYTGSYQDAGLFEHGSEEAAQGDFTREEYEAAVRKAIEDKNQERKAIENVRDANVTDEQQQKIYQYTDAVNNIDNAQEYMRQNEEAYNSAVQRTEVSKAMYQMTIAMLKTAGVDTSEMEKASQVSDFLLNFAQYIPTEWKSYSTYDVCATALGNNSANKEEVFSTAKEMDEEIQKNIELAKWLFDYAEQNGIQMPDSVKENVLRWEEKLEREHEDFDYMNLMNESDFDAGAKKGREMAANPPEFDFTAFGISGKLDTQPGWDLLSDDQKKELKSMAESYDIADVANMYNGYMEQMDVKNRLFGTYRMGELMTDYEKDTFYYLLATKGLQGAEEYYSHLTDDSYGVMNSRAADITRENADNLAGSGFWGRRGADVLSMLLSPVAAIGSLYYMADTGLKKLRGERVELNPENINLSANIYKKEARQKIQEEINNTYKNPVVRKLMSGLQEIISNRGDSFVNMVAFGPLFKSLGIGSEFVTASPMAFTAATDAVADAKANGASDTQLLGIFASTFLAEAGTETIEIGDMMKAFQGGVSGSAMKEFLKKWLTQSGISEAFGESLNDIIENTADEIFMGDQSEFAKAVKRYEEEEHMDRAHAEVAARRDQMMGVLHTALISYLSPGLDIASYGGGRFLYYRDQARKAQEDNKNYSIFDIMRQDKEKRELAGKIDQYNRTQEEIAEIERNNTAKEDAANASEGEASVATPDANLPQFDANAQQLTLDYEALESAKEAATTSQTATISKIIDTQGTEVSGVIADAAAVNVGSLFEGKNPAESVQELIVGAHSAGVDANDVKRAIQVAALSKDSNAYKVTQSEEFKKANPADKAQMLSRTTYSDSHNLAVMSQIRKSVFENRVAFAEKEAVNDPAVQQKQKVAYDAQGRLLDAQQATTDAQNQYDALSNELDAKRDNLRNADPANPNEVNRAISELEKTGQVVQEYKQRLENAQKAEQKAQEEVDRAVDDYAATKRQVAEQIALGQDQQRAEAAVQAEAEAQAQAELAEQQRIAEEEDNNANIADEEGYFAALEEKYGPLDEKDKQRARESFARVREQRAAQQATPQGDDFGALNDPSAEKRRKAAAEVERRFNLKIVTLNTREAEGRYFEGRFAPDKNTIYLDNQNISNNDIMYKVLGHELTHIAALAGQDTYNALANSIARIFYGNDADVKQAIDNLEKNNGVPTNQLEAGIMKRKADYDKRFGNVSYEYAAQEHIADRMGEIINQRDEAKRQDMVNRLVADDPSTARRLLNTIKSFLKKAVGLKGAWVSNAQKTVDMLEKAVLAAQEGKQATNGNRYSLASENTLVEGDDGEPLATELPGGTVIADTNSRYSLASFTPDEQERVRQALYNKKDANGKKEFTKKEVDKYLEDAMSLAKMIADDRQRLDFVASDNQVFLKPNNDYYFTLDASTLCAKRLLYQGTFDYVQHALPDEVFTPSDLIDLANIMNEMGYETPCGICYVESRRRWLDTYANDFIEKVQKNEDDYVEKFIDKNFKKAPDEEKTALRERLAGEMPSIDDLTTSDGLEKLRKNDPVMYRAFVAAMNAKGSANPKVVQLRTEYRGDIVKNMSKKDIQKVKDIGGLRIQSFSDFETPHLLDMVQAVYDMASVGLTSQAYTKVPNFAWVFGDTGIKINLSLIGKGTGLDENGNLVFDNREGIDFDEAMKLRERYNKNVGTILVGINDDHIIAAMGDPRIDFIIPFHKSGWSQEELRKMPTLNNYNDYTDSQNELMIVGDRKHRVKEIKNMGMKALDNWIVKEGDDHPGYKVIDQGNGKYTVTYDIGYETESFKKHKERTGNSFSNFEPVGANQYWDFKKSGEWNANKYLKMCAEAGRIPKFSQFLVDNGDGTFSLPKGKDKRSTAIREGYWKTLIDFKMYENDGYGRTQEDGTKTKVKGSAQREVTPDINMNEAYRVMNEYQLGRQMPDKENGQKGAFLKMNSNNDVPVATDAGDRYIELIKEKRRGDKPVNPDDTLQASPSIDVGSLGQSAFHQGPSDDVNLNARTTFGATEAPAVLGNENNEYVDPAEAQNAMAIDSETGETVNYRLSLPSDQEYISAVENNDIEAAQRIVDEQAKKNGYSIKAYHGTPTGGFTEFDLSKINYGRSFGNGIYFSDSRNVAENFSRPYGRTTGDVNPMVYESYLNLGDKPYIIDVDQMRSENGQGKKPSLMRYLIKEAIGKVPEDATSVVLKGIYDGSDEKSTVYVIKNPNQTKSADPVTYDDQGNVIPPSERFNDQKKDIRYSLPSDAPYLSAVDHGDTETAQRMVDEKAQENGYIKAGYHGTLSGGFTIFDKAKAGIGGNSGAGFYFSSNSDDANANYSDVEGADNWFKANHLADHILDEFRNSDEEEFEYEGYEITEGMPYDEVVDIAKKILTKNPEIYNVYLNPGKAYIRDFNNSTNLIEDVINNFDESMYSPDDYDSEDDYYDALSMARSDEIWQAISDAVYNGIADVDSNYEIYSNVNYEDIIGKLAEIAIDYETLTWNDLIKVLGDQYIEIGTDDMTESADGSHEIARAIVEAFGFDSIEDREVSKKFNQLKNMGNAGDTTHYIMFRPDQIKLADPVTYDDQGNVIPLSERFKQTNNDIRYSLPSDDILDQQINEYLNNGGVLSPTPNQDTGYRQWGNEGAQRSDELDQQAKDIVLNSEYTRDTNAAELDRAISWIRGNKLFSDDDGFQESLRKVTDKRFNYRTKDGQARMVAVMALAVARNDVAAQVQLAEAYNEQGTDLGQALQARKLFRLMTPQGRVASLQKMVHGVTEQLESRGIYKDIRLSDWIIQAASAAKNESEFNKARQAAAIELAEQLPANWKDRLRGLRMLSMLGNPRTHIRNIIGNAMFVPAVSLKNKLSAVAENIFLDEGERTKTLSLTLPKEIKDFVQQDSEFVKDELTGEAKYNEGNLVQQNQKPFKGFLQTLMDFNSNALEKEDWFFLKGHYRRALGGWIQANGYTVSQLKSNPLLLEQGRAYAINEAQKATYRDFNGLADRLNKLSRKPQQTTGEKILGFATDAVLPFKKTPANILKRGIEYSPVGLARGIKNLMFDMKNGKVTPTQVIDRICSGLAGTAILAMGAFLGHAGIASCGLGDDDDKFEKAQGGQKYAIRFNLFGEDVTYTMDWAAPMSMPFFVGAAVYEQLAKGGSIDINGLMDAMSNIAEPVLNLSMLDGVNTLFKTSQNDDTDTMTQIGAKVLSNYVSSYVPSLLGAVARTIDGQRRATFVKSGEGKGVTGTFKYAIEQAENKIPGLSQTNIPVRDVFGRAEEDSIAERIFENWISPGYISHYKNDPVLNEMDRLYGANVEDSANMIPKDPPKYIEYNKQKTVLTAEQWDVYKTERGRTAYEMLTSLINSSGYKAADEAAQVQMIKKVWDYANEVGKKAVLPDYEINDSKNGSVESFTRDGKVGSYTAKMMQALDQLDYESYETMIEALHEEEVEDSTIKTKIANKYRDQYKDAYRKNNFEKMDEIEERLSMTDFEFDLEKWEDDVDKKYGDNGSNQPIGVIASNGGLPSRGQDTTGQYGLGNIDLNNRKVVNNEDGSISTERSMSFYDEDSGKEVLIPTVVNGRIVSDEEAIDHYYETGEYLGMFDTPEEADRYAERLHNRQDWYYNR